MFVYAGSCADRFVCKLMELGWNSWDLGENFTVNRETTSFVMDSLDVKTAAFTDI